MPWSSLLSNQTVSFANLKDAVDTGVFTAKTTITPSNEQITKADANTYINFTTTAAYNAKTSNQLIVKSDILEVFTFDADYILLTYQFTDGQDLDTRTRIVVPNVGQDSQSKYVGWASPSVAVWPTSGTPILRWGGDNLGTGFEAVLINLIELKSQYPSATTLLADLRGMWWVGANNPGTNPVVVSGTLWKGGTPIQQGSTGSPAFSFTNPTATATLSIASAGKQVTTVGGATSSGDRVATLTYDLSNSTGFFNINDTTTPSV